MVIDTSVLIAILMNEPDAEHYRRRIELASDKLISTATLVEASMVALSRGGERGVVLLRGILAEMQVLSVSFTAEQSETAIDAFRRFGKGRHPASLNLGDCFTYALAKTMNEPLLFKGDDFSRTDVTRA